MLRVVNFVLGPLRNNTYLITDEETGTSLVIDPSFGSEQVAAYAAREQIHIDKILLTHGHNDHVAGVPALQRQYKGMRILTLWGCRDRLFMDPSIGCRMGILFHWETVYFR